MEFLDSYLCDRLDKLFRHIYGVDADAEPEMKHGPILPNRLILDLKINKGGRCLLLLLLLLLCVYIALNRPQEDSEALFR